MSNRVSSPDDGLYWKCDAVSFNGNQAVYGWGGTDYFNTFRYNRGYASGSTTASYYYDRAIYATLNKRSEWGSATTATNKSGYSTQCVINGSKLSIVVGNEYAGTGAGYPIYTKADEFYIKGSITYK